ncbi:hypothetical protein [Aureimonas sp. AU4]|uniref:hypothetical protein n=1 Tax=Aureimonas sp. AU4 TaxID=1638163 RepID=UPI000780F687|nr:hypothetical protein [Aureimonas sp. AU4]
MTTVDLYRRKGGAPAELLAVAYTDQGYSRTDLANQPDSRAELGFMFFGRFDPVMQAVVKHGDGYAIVPIEDAGATDPADLPALVDAERDRRIQGGITFNGTVFQTDDTSRERI